MGNCIDFGRPSTSRLQQRAESDKVKNRLNLNSSTSNPLTLLPFVLQQPNFSPPGSPVSTFVSPICPKSNQTHVSVRTPSSSGVSSASSSTTSPVHSRSINDNMNNNNNHFQYVAIFDYDARTKDDLTLRKSDLIEITYKKSAAWWKAKNEQGQEGWIPSNYVAKRDSLESEP